MPQVVKATGASAQTWVTPEWVLDLVRQIGPIGLDPATSAENPTRAATTFTETEDGLKQAWAGRGLVFVNCPWRTTYKWAAKCAAEAAKGSEIVLLAPASTETAWFHDSILPNAERICLLRGRVAFVDSVTGVPGTAPPCGVLLAYFGPNGSRFEDVFGTKGWVW